MKKLILAMAFAASINSLPVLAGEMSPADLSDLQMAHVAYIADNIDIRYAHLALAISQDPAIREFAQTMIRDHTAVNEQAFALLEKLNAKPEDNFLSKQLQANAEKLIDEMSRLRGEDFDQRYAENELAYHQAVNELVGETFIPNIENDEVRALFEAGLEIFKVHEAHAEKMVSQIR